MFLTWNEKTLLGMINLKRTIRNHELRLLFYHAEDGGLAAVERQDDHSCVDICTAEGLGRVQFDGWSWLGHQCA